MRQKGFAPVIILFVIIAFIVLGFMFSKSFNNRTQPSPSILPKPTLSAGEKTLQDWSSTVSGNIVTFSNGSSKYSFTVPVGWKTQPVCNGGVKDDKYICIMSPDLEQNAVPVVERGQLFVIAPPGSSYFVASFIDNPQDFCKAGTMDIIKNCDTSDLNGQKIIKKVFSNYSFIDVAILKDNKINLTVRLEYPYPVGYKDNTFDKFLSTLKFSP